MPAGSGAGCLNEFENIFSPGACKNGFLSQKETVLINFAGFQTLPGRKAPDSGVFWTLLYKSAAINRVEKKMGLAALVFGVALCKSFFDGKRRNMRFFLARHVFIRCGRRKRMRFSVFETVAAFAEFCTGVCDKINRLKFILFRVFQSGFLITARRTKVKVCFTEQINAEKSFFVFFDGFALRRSGACRPL